MPFWLLLLSVLYAKRSMVSTSPDSVGFWSTVVIQAGFARSDHDSAMFVSVYPRGRAILLLYVDDIKLTGDYSVTISLIECRLHQLFAMKALTRPKPFLGLEVASHILLVDIWYLRSNNVMTWSLELNSMMSVDTPLELYVKLRPTDGSPLSDPTQYRQ